MTAAPNKCQPDISRAYLSQVLKQYAKDIRAACSGSSGDDPGWKQAEILDFVADNFNEIATNQPEGPQP